MASNSQKSVQKQINASLKVSRILDLQSLNKKTKSTSHLQKITMDKIKIRHQNNQKAAQFTLTNNDKVPKILITKKSVAEFNYFLYFKTLICKL